MSAFKVGRSEKKGLSNKLLHRRGFGPVITEMWSMPDARVTVLLWRDIMMKPFIDQSLKINLSTIIKL